MKGRMIAVFGFFIMMMVSINSTGGNVGPQEKGFSDPGFNSEKTLMNQRPLFNAEESEAAEHGWLAFLERQAFENREIIEDMQMNQRNEEKCEELNNDENHTGKTVFVGPYDYRYPSSYGYISSDIGEELVFDFSQMYRLCNLKEVESYELDLDGDGVYGIKSSVPTCVYSYEEYGVYRAKLRISGYYPKYPPIPYDSKAPYHWDSIQYKEQASYEYEIKVSVGGREAGYPAIPDFSVSGFDYSNLDTYKKKVYDSSSNPYCIDVSRLNLSAFDFSSIAYISGDDGTESAIRACSVLPITINDYKKEPIFLDPTVECDASITIKPDGSETDYCWDFGDGVCKRGKNVKHTYNHGGEYEITLYVNNKVDWKSNTVNVLRGRLDPKIIIITNDNYLEPTEGYLTSYTDTPVVFDLSKFKAPEPGIWYEWDFDGDGHFEYNLSSPKLTYEFTKVGLFEVRFRINILKNHGQVSTSEYIIHCLVGSRETGYPPLPDFNIRSRTDLMVPQNQEEQDTPQFTLRVQGAGSEEKPAPIQIRNTGIDRGNAEIDIQDRTVISDDVEFNIQLRNPVSIQEPVITTPAPIRIIDWWPSFPVFRWHYEVDEEVLAKLKRNCNFVEPHTYFSNTPGQYLLGCEFTPKGTGLESHGEWGYFWDFGDGNQSSGCTSTHVYQGPGLYNVTLWVHNGFFNISKTTTIRVDQMVRSKIPFIYLYPENPTFDDVTVRFQGRAVLTLPEVEMGSEIMWKDIWADKNIITYNGQTYDYLIYECDIVPVSSKFGWILERDKLGRFYLDGASLTYEDLKTFFRDELKKAGLYENEIQDFLGECLGDDEFLFFGQEAFRYAIRYIPPETLDQVMHIETKVEYDNIIRFQFLVESLEGDEVLTPPTYPEHSTSGASLHEWGIIKGSNIP